MKNLFTGWRQVFNFTASQTVKGKGFKLSTFGVFAVIVAIFIAVNCIMAHSQLDKEEKDIIDLKDTTIKKVHFTCTDVSNPEFVNAIVEFTKSSVKKIEIVTDSKDIPDNNLIDKKGEIVMEAYEEEGLLKFNFYISDKSKVKKSDAGEFASKFLSIVNTSKYTVSGLDTQTVGMITASNQTSPQVVSVDEIEKAHNDGIMLMEMIVPMIYSFVFYFMVFTYGQSVSKSVMAEKTSKLMETLLTSVKPYAVITGKVLSIALICIGQALFWIVGGVLGFVIGDKIALSINPDYINYIGEVVEIMKNDTKGAFTVTAVIFAVISMVLGFFVYCILAALSSAVCNRIEDMANSQLIFQMPVMVGFMVSYLGPLLIESKAVNTFIRFFPITSPFSLPAEVIIGKALLWEGALSIVILLVSCILLVLFTGKIYKNKVFNR